jgi:hypothetical protein
VTVDDLIDIALPEANAPRSWDRSRGTLLNRRERLLGLAIASGEQLDASLLYARENDGRVAIWNLSVSPGRDGEAALRTLFRDLAHRESGPLSIPRAEESEIALDLLTSLGFARERETVGVAAEARSRA